MFFVTKKRFLKVIADLADADRKLEVSENNYKSLWEDYNKLQKELDKAKSTVYKPVVGYPEGTVEGIIAGINTLIEGGMVGHKKPTEYVRGLKEAIKCAEVYKPQELN